MNTAMANATLSPAVQHVEHPRSRSETGRYIRQRGNATTQGKQSENPDHREVPQQDLSRACWETKQHPQLHQHHTSSKGTNLVRIKRFLQGSRRRSTNIFNLPQATRERAPVRVSANTLKVISTIMRATSGPHPNTGTKENKENTVKTSLG